MGLLDNLNSPAPVAPDPRNTQQTINGIPIPNAAPAEKGVGYLEPPDPSNPTSTTAPKQPHPAAGRIKEVMDKMQMQPTPDNLKAVVMGVAKGKPMDPRVLVSNKRKSLQDELDEAMNIIKTDSDFRKYYAQVKEGKEQEQRNAMYSPYGLHKYSDSAAAAGVDPQLELIKKTKLDILNKRVEGIQNQMISLDTMETKLILGSALTNDADYQDFIKAILNNQAVPTTLAREQEANKTEIDKRTLEATTQKNALDAQRLAKNDAFNQQKDIAQLDINQQNADSNRLRAENAGKNQGKQAQRLENSIKMKQVDVQNTMNMVKDVAQKIDFGAFNWADQAKVIAEGFMEKAGMDIGEDGRKHLGERRTQFEGIGQLFNQYRKMITGAAASVQELDRLEETFLNKKLSETQAKASLQRFLKMTIRDSKIFQEMADAGVDLNNKNDLNSFYDTAKFRYDLDDPALVAEAERSAPLLFYGKPVTDEDREILRNGGKVITLYGQKIIATPEQIAKIRAQGIEV